MAHQEPKMALIDTIQRLHQQNWSQRRIATELQIDDRETVSRYLRLAEAPNQPAPRRGGCSKIQNQPLRTGRSTILYRPSAPTKI